MKIVKDGYSLIVGIPVAGLVLGMLIQTRCPVTATVLYALGIAGCVFMLYFFRDPERTPDCGPEEFVSAADGTVRSVEYMEEKRFLKCPAVRISVFLSPFNVHVNRHAMGGTIVEAGYTPGRHLFTIDPKSSEYNEHSSILVQGEKTRCLERQIVGPIVRRVVYWQEAGARVEKGQRLGMMKFGSRMDLYFPADEVEAVVKRGDKVAAGLTVIARLKKAEG